jgi:hypothetical protein
MIPLGHTAIRGNHERQLIELPSEAMSLSDRLALSQLRPRDLERIRRLPERA